AATGQRHPLVLLGEALGTEDGGREAQVLAARAALDLEPTLATGGPVGRTVLRDARQRLVDGEHQTFPSALRHVCQGFRGSRTVTIRSRCPVRCQGARSRERRRPGCPPARTTWRRG